MEMLFVLIVVAVIGVAGYRFFRGNTNRGVETVRAYIYLSALKLGRTTDEANEAARYDIVNGPTDIIQLAMHAVKTQYNGKQLPMIAEAKRLGMVSP